ncbi:MAG: non-heme iron oxygenase ferredoxin subunit [Ilumatobacteraceae bacterium]
MNSEHFVCALADIADGAVKRVDIGDVEIALVRIGDKVYAIGDRCSHANVSLSEGEVHPDTMELECIKHGSAFSLETGEPSSLPATQPVPVYTSDVVNGNVVITISDGATP